MGAVSYLNTRPLLYGIENSPVMAQMDLTLQYPSKLAAQLQEDEIDLGLVPVAVIPLLPEHHIYTDYCIGSKGPVASVCIFSDVPISEVKKVLMDYQSRTSVKLAGILLKEYWQVGPVIENTTEDYRSRIHEMTAGLVIGDRALEMRGKTKYIYDLGEAWEMHTGLPFVFAAWVSNKALPEDFIEAFNEANKEGLGRIDELVMELSYAPFDLKAYYSRHISYSFNDEKKMGLELFLSKLKNSSITR